MKMNLWKMCLGISRQEMFSNSTVSLDRRGLAGMGYVNNLIEIKRVA